MNAKLCKLFTQSGLMIYTWWVTGQLLCSEVVSRLEQRGMDPRASFVIVEEVLGQPKVVYAYANYSMTCVTQ